jgi:uncharacterized membrane protein (TIGR02234 family)
MTRDRSWLAIALIADLIGAAAALLLAGRAWQHVRVDRTAPLADAVGELTGRDLQGAITAFALIGLAGVVAIAATRGWGRRLVGLALLVCAGVIAWCALSSFSAVSDARARSAITSGVGIDASSPVHVSVSVLWPALTAVAALLIALGGGLTLLFAGRWSAMAARYDAPTEAARLERTAHSGGDIAMWTALDRGDDPTGDQPRTES